MVTVLVRLAGKKLPDNYDNLRSMAVCRALDQKLNLIPATKNNARKMNCYSVRWITELGTIQMVYVFRKVLSIVVKFEQFHLIKSK
ncbi:MAG: hypothetical protein WCY86_07250 [Spirosomataceae bacterium]